MTQLTRRSRLSFPSIVNDFFESGRMFPSLLDMDGDLLDFYTPSNRIPGVNIVENDKDFTFEMAAPGFQKNDFKVEIEDNVLNITAEKEEQEEEEDKNYKRKEYSYNSFTRSFTLPENSITEKLDAKYENGILKLTLPKKEITVSKAAKEIKVQ